LAILGLFSPERLAQIIAAQDKTALTAAEGVGPKLALRLITELKDKVAHIMTTPALKGASVAAVPLTHGGVTEDALSALMHLGYRRLEAFAAIGAASAKLGEGAKLDALIRAALAELSQKDATP
jgi:Holliday junction DNA helicase RuvA